MEEKDATNPAIKARGRKNFVVAPEKPSTTDKSKSDLSPLLIYFSSTTTAHGFLHIINTPNKRGKILWVIFMLLAVAGVAFHFTNIINSHLQHEVTTEIRNDASKFIYPDITFCLNYHYKEITQQTSNRLPLLGNVTFEEFFNISNLIFRKAIKTEDDIMFLSRRAFAKYGYHAGFYRILDDYLLSCNFGETNCLTERFSEIFQHENGVCITYKASEEIVKKGIENGLVITPFFEGSIDSNMKLLPIFRYGSDRLRKLEGLIYLHPPGSHPDWRMSRMILNPGTKMTVRLDMVQYKRTPFAGLCVETTKSHHIRDAQSGKQRTYSYWWMTCKALTTQLELVKRCACLSEDFPVPAEIDIKSVPFCHEVPRHVYDEMKANTSDITLDRLKQETGLLAKNHRCHDSVLIEQAERSDWKKVCPESCSAPRYTWTETSNSWPPKFSKTDYQKYLFNLVYSRGEDYATKYNVLINTTSWHHYLVEQMSLDDQRLKFYSASHFGRVVFYTESSKTLLFEDSETYPMASLIANVGGILGLWIGVSVMSMIEFAELVVIATAVLARKLMKKD